MSEDVYGPQAEVVGIGETGCETISQIATETATRFHTLDASEDRRRVLSDIDASNFVFVSADLGDARVPTQAGRFLRELDAACTVVFVEGTTNDPGSIVESTDLLLPLTVDSGRRPFVAGVIADLCETMLPPTIADLGYGEIAVVAGSDRVGKLYIDHFDTTEPIHDLTPGFELSSPDALLLYLCAGVDLGPAIGPSTLDAYDRFECASSLCDRRVHDRYRNRAHIKRLVTADASTDDRLRLLTNR